MSNAKKIKDAEIYRLAPSYEKNLDNLKLLLSDPDVKKTITAVREFLKIHPGGFTKQKPEPTEAEIADWWNKMYQRSNEIRKSERFRDCLKKIKENVKAKKLDEHMAQKQIDLLYRELPENHLTDTVITILRQCNLPINYEDSIRRYIVFGDFTVPAHPYSVISDRQEPLVRLFESVTIRFYSKLTDDDMKSLKHFINEGFFGQALPESPEPIKNLDKILEVQKMNLDEKRPYTEDTIIRRTAREKAEAINLKSTDGKLMTVHQVHDTPRQLEKLWKKRFKKSFGE